MSGKIGSIVRLKPNATGWNKDKYGKSFLLVAGDRPWADLHEGGKISLGTFHNFRDDFEFSYPLGNVVFKVNHPAHSVKVQKHLFSLGYRWSVYKDQVAWSGKPYVFASDTGIISYGENNTCRRGWKECKLTETVTFGVEELPVPTPPPLVSLNGKLYRKSDIEEALLKLTPVQ